MSKAIKVEKWKAQDGMLFDSQEETENYEVASKLAIELNDEGVVYDDDANKIAEFIVRHYILTARKDLP